jgi:hypothetical protein
VPELTPLERDLRQLEVDLRKLEAEYNMFFAGQLPKAPLEMRGRVEAMIRQYDRSYIQRYSDRFRFSTLQARYAKFVELWDRGLRAMEESGPGPFSKRRQAATRNAPASPAGPVEFAATISDPALQASSVRELHARLVEANRSVGQNTPPLSKFTRLVASQVQELRKSGMSEVTFRVAVKDGKVVFTARAGKDSRDG